MSLSFGIVTGKKGAQICHTQFAKILYYVKNKNQIVKQGELSVKWHMACMIFHDAGHK